MKTIYKDQFRKIKHNLFNFISLSILVIIISMTYTGVKTSIDRLEGNHKEYLESQNLEDFYFSMGNIDLNYLSGSVAYQLCNELDLLYEYGIALSFPNDPTYINNLNILINDKLKNNLELYESVIDGYIEQFADEYNFIVEKNYIVDVEESGKIYKFLDVTNNIDIPYLVDGSLPTEDNEVAIFPEFAELNNINIGDYITVRDVQYLVTGYIYKPEFLFPIFNMSTINFDQENQTIMLTTKQTVINLNEQIYIKYLVQGNLEDIFPNFGYEDIQNNDYSFLGKQMQMITLLYPSDINFRIIALDTEITNANAFINLFLPMFIGLVVLLLLIFMKRYIDKNKHDIDTLKALGYSNNEITKSLLIFPLILSLMTIIGYGFGLIISLFSFNAYSSRYLYPKSDFFINIDVLIYAIIIPIIVIILINYIYISINLNTKYKIKKIKIFKLFKYIDLKTTLYSIFLFSIVSILITFGLSGNTMFSSFMEETKLGNNYDKMIVLQYMTNDDYNDDYEQFTRVTGKITKINQTDLENIKSTTVYGIFPTNDLKLLVNNDLNNNLLLENGVIISEYLNTSLNLKIGDTITFTISDIVIEKEVVGISNELLENNLFMNINDLNQIYNLDSTYYNGLYTTDNNYYSPYIFTTVDYNNSLDEFTSILNISSIILNYLVTLSVILAIFIFGLIMVNFINDHKIDIAILKSVGLYNIEINKKYYSLLYILLIICYIFSIFITKYLLNYLLKILMDSIGFKLIVNISAINIIIGFVVLQLLFFIIILNSNKFFDKIYISDLLKHNIK